jgi:hypothetical protein
MGDKSHVRWGSNSDLALGASEVSSYINNGHEVRKSNVMEQGLPVVEIPNPPSANDMQLGKLPFLPLNYARKLAF